MIYKFVKLLGEGSYGKAFLCTSKEDNSYCVIKQINMTNMNEKEKNETVNEAKILKKLDHPNIIKFKDVFQSKKPISLNIVTEYADGGDLSIKIKSHQKNKSYFPENEILDIFTQICSAIKHIHHKKILHRDLKSQNVFMTKSGLVKLGDFGIAKSLNNTWQKASTMVGTPYYLSPEIVSNKPYSFKSDIWSLGVLLYEMMALRMPFDANSLPMLSLKIMKGNYTPPPNHYSNELKNLVKKLLNVKPDDRPTVDQILKEPIIVNRIHKYLGEVDYNRDFNKSLVKYYKIENRNRLKESKILKEEKKVEKINSIIK